MEHSWRVQHGEVAEQILFQQMGLGATHCSPTHSLSKSSTSLCSVLKLDGFKKKKKLGRFWK